jgi:hypothetical protein
MKQHDTARRLLHSSSLTAAAAGTTAAVVAAAQAVSPLMFLPHFHTKLMLLAHILLQI